MEGNLKSLAWDCSVWDFPGSPVVKNMPSNVWDMSLIPGWGTKIPHATGQISLWATTTESAISGGCMSQLESLHIATKIPCASTKIQHSQIKKLIFLKIAMSMGDLKKGIMKVLEFRGKVWLDLEFEQSSAHRLLLLFKL